MRFSRFPPPPGQSFGRKPDDAVGHDHSRPPSPLAPRRRAGAPGLRRRPAPPDPVGAAGSAARRAAGATAGGGWQPVAAPASGRSLIDELAAEAESAGGTRRARPGADDAGPGEPGNAGPTAAPRRAADARCRR